MEEYSFILSEPSVPPVTQTHHQFKSSPQYTSSPSHPVLECGPGGTTYFTKVWNLFKSTLQLRLRVCVSPTAPRWEFDWITRLSCTSSVCSLGTAGCCFPWPDRSSFIHWLRYTLVLQGMFPVCWLLTWHTEDAGETKHETLGRRRNSLVKAATLLIQPPLRQPSEVTGFRL